MPIYELECSFCGLHSDHIFGMDEMDKKAECPHCGENLCRREHRFYTPPIIQGDTVAGGCSYNYFDEGMNEYVTSKQHRKDLMEQKGLVEYAPDPEMKKHRDESRYIRKNMKEGDGQALAAIDKEHRAAQEKRRTKQVEASINKALDTV